LGKSSFELGKLSFELEKSSFELGKFAATRNPPVSNSLLDFSPLDKNKSSIERWYTVTFVFFTIFKRGGPRLFGLHSCWLVALGISCNA
jgi:hypothetical protein